MLLEVLSSLTMGFEEAERGTAALAWKGLRAIYPRGYGIGYSHLDGVVEEGLHR